jgi:hypothetical protein
MKGIVPLILIAFAAMASILIAEGIFFNVFIGSRATKEETTRELEILTAVNKIEMVKRGLPHALYYSFLEAMKEAGYNSVEDIKDSTEFVKSINSIFNEYRMASEENIGVKIPGGEITLDISGNQAVIDFSSSGLLAYETDFVKVYDKPSVTIKVVGNSLIE